MAKKDLTPACSNPSAYRMDASTLQEIEQNTVKSIQSAKRRVADAAAAAAKAAAVAAPPLGNTGGKSKLPDTEKFVSVGGEIKAVPARRGWGGDAAFIDWVNVVVHESTFETPQTFAEFLEVIPDTPVTDDGLILVVSHVVESIFGFAITKVLPKGIHFYQRSYAMEGADGQKYGVVGHGGQRNTILISISGEGCTAAREGWELRLKSFLEKSHDGHITRIDLAYDDYTGQTFSVDGLEKSYDEGGFNCGGRNPDIELRGNWKNPTGKGRTIYVGSRENGKFFRGYEKGKQLGDPASLWVRCETAFRSVDRVIPFDVLLHAGQYLAAAYPVLNGICQRQERILTTQKSVQASYERIKTWLKHQCGAALHLMHQIEGNSDAVLNEIMREGKKPRGMVIPNFVDALNPIHMQHRESLPLDAVLELSFTH